MVPRPDPRFLHIGDGQAAEGRHDMQPGQILTKLASLGTKAEPLTQPSRSELRNLDLTCIRIEPFPLTDLGLLVRPPNLSVALRSERLRNWPINAIRPRIPNLPAARRQLADPTETPPARHQAAARR